MSQRFHDLPQDEVGTFPVVVRLDTVVPQTVEWLWAGRVPRGKLTLVIGDPGVGKSFLVLEMMAHFSHEAPWCDGAPAPLGDSVLLTAEDGLADTVAPRLAALGGDPARIHAVTAMRSAGVERAVCLETDLAPLEAVIQRTGALLVGVDPLSAYLGHRDTYKDAEIRSVLGPLAALAERTGVAILGVMHLTKDQQRRVLYRVLGSIAFVAAARVVLAVAPDPADAGRRLLVTVKNNLIAHAPALAFSLAGGRLTWQTDPIGPVDPDHLLSPGGEDRAERVDAEALLRELLADGERASKDLCKAAEGNGISWHTLVRAKRRLGVRTRHEGQPGRVGGAWYWSLPEECQPVQPAPEECHTAGSGILRGSPRENSRNDAGLPEGCHNPGSGILREPPDPGVTLRRPVRETGGPLRPSFLPGQWVVQPPPHPEACDCRACVP
jgi:hypothetical protein